MKITAEPITIAMQTAFRISRGSRTECHVVRVYIEHDDKQAQGECTPYPRYGESSESVLAQIQQASSALEAMFERGITDPAELRDHLQSLLTGGAARNAVDCALWELEAKQHNQLFPNSLFELPTQIVTAMTVSIGTPEAMATQTRDYVANGVKLLKVKLDGEQVVERVRAVREAAPDVQIVLDANEAWTGLNLEELLNQLTEFDIAMIEQPLPQQQDASLAHIEHPILLCADESCHTTSQLSSLLGKYEMVNIKLDKTGGLTEALALAEEAQKLGFTLMSGCMLGTSLAMRAALPIAVQSEIVDLDGPVLLGQDVSPALTYRDGMIIL
ncbi:N-acetyl-D-Glu racemase DgcA [Vibrio cyclitrophicus]